MKNKIRFLAGLLVLAMLIGVCPAFADNSAETAEAVSAADKNSVTIGTLTALDGVLYGNMFGNNTTDIDLRLLLTDYSTIALTKDHTYDFNKVVLRRMENREEKHGKTYTFMLRDNLCYNDGTPITAKDYVFTILLQSSPEMASLGGKVTNYSQFYGWEQYSSGESSIFYGVRLLDDYTFSVTIVPEALDYFYELMYVTDYPTPISEIAPECEVKDDGYGAYIEGEFTAELLEDTFLDEEDGYMYFPRVTSGPYQLDWVNREEHTASFTRNKYYKGNYEGEVPSIGRINIVHVTNDNMYDFVNSGEVDIIHKILQKENIDTALNRSDGYTVRYLRAGYGFLSYDCLDEVTEELDVRQAVAYMLDKDRLTDNFAGEYGYRVYGCYGAGQWMSLYNEGYYVDVIEETVNHYDKDMYKALVLLEENGWTLNENGERYTSADKVRYREKNGELIPLEIRLAWGDDNVIGPELAKMMQLACEELGVKLIAEEIPFEDLLQQYYRQQEREYNIMLLGTNFDYVFDPMPMVSNEEEYQGIWNASGIDDVFLKEDAYSLNHTKRENPDEYASKWVRFQQRWAKVLPTLPLYSNVYYDFVRSGIEGFYTDSFSSWALSVPYMKLV